MREITSTSATKHCRARNRKEVVFYFLARILENEERESRRKKVKDTLLFSRKISIHPCSLCSTWYCTK